MNKRDVADEMAQEWLNEVDEKYMDAWASDIGLELGPNDSNLRESRAAKALTTKAQQIREIQQAIADNPTGLVAFYRCVGFDHRVRFITGHEPVDRFQRVTVFSDGFNVRVGLMNLSSIAFGLPLRYLRPEELDEFRRCQEHLRVLPVELAGLKRCVFDA